MRCPKCKEKMSEVKKDITNDPTTKIQYDRTIFKCEKDNVWITLETPTISEAEVV